MLKCYTATQLKFNGIACISSTFALRVILTQQQTEQSECCREDECLLANLDISITPPLAKSQWDFYIGF